jgi:hypothetical protein
MKAYHQASRARGIGALFAAALLAAVPARALDIEPESVAFYNSADVEDGVNITDALREGTTLFLYAELSFEGFASRRSWSIAWYWDGMLLHEMVVNNHGPGISYRPADTIEVVVATPTFLAQPGTHTLSIRVDSRNGLIETSESNNELKREFTVPRESTATQLFIYDDPRNVDGDSLADAIVHVASEPEWYIRRSSGGISDIPLGRIHTYQVIGDFDGDGRSDPGLYNPGAGRWDVLGSTAGLIEFNFGFPGTLPVPGHYDADGITDIAVYHPVSGNWSIRFSMTTLSSTTNWGYPQARPVPRDYTGDGLTDIAVFDPVTGNWFVRRSGPAPSLLLQNFNQPGSVPVPADYDGDGEDDFAVYQRATGNWFILQSGSGTVRIQNWGFSRTLPVPANYDGDTRDDICVYYPESGTWFILSSLSSSLVTFQFGYFAALPAGVAPY